MKMEGGRTDITILGDVVNTTARLSSEAATEYSIFSAVTGTFPCLPPGSPVKLSALTARMKPSEALKKYTKRIERSSQQLLRMVVNLLDISRFEEGRSELSKDPVNLNEMITEIVQRVKEYPENLNKEIISDLDGQVGELILDKSVIGRVIENLISFATNNTGEGGRVDLKTRSVDKQTVEFTLHDNGTQIPQKFQDKIFEKYSQAEIKNAGYRVERALGLTFCKMAIEAHKGNMQLDLNNPVGNRFVIELNSLS